MAKYIDLYDDRNCYIGEDGEYQKWNIDPKVIEEAADVVEVVRCGDCKHQEVYCYETKGKKYFSYNCELSENNSHVCLDDDFCSRGERREK